jgi:hypothetical protein
MQEFLNPKSMITPGVAGTLLMFLVNGLCVPFPELPPRYVALVLSFAIGLILVRSLDCKLMERGIYWILNSLVIFIVGFGATNLARSATSGGSEQPETAGPSSLTFQLVRAPHAADAAPAKTAKPVENPNPNKQPAEAAARKGPTPEEERLRLELEGQKQENEKLRKKMKEEKPAAAKAPARMPSFFKSW